MDYQLVFDPELGLSADEFISAWNDAPESRDLAEARQDPQQLEGFPLDPQLVQQGLVLLAGTLGPVALDALLDAVKGKLTQIFKRKLDKALPGEPEPAIQVKAVPQPGGAVLLVVTEGEA